ncbi:MAG: Ribonuclease P protein component [Mycoplasmataceae bacterium]|nr:MAG: Ribonuclease P protein component [Mycoplasmataceae bacterium]
MKQLWNNYRLRKTQEFQEIIKKRRKIFNNQLIIFYSEKKDKENCRFGISIPKKIVKKAVHRNKYKRQIKSALISIIKEKNKPLRRISNWDFVLVIKESFIKESFQKNKEDLKKLLNFFIWKNNNNQNRSNFKNSNEKMKKNENPK